MPSFTAFQKNAFQNNAFQIGIEEAAAGFFVSNGEFILAAFERVYIRTGSIRQEHLLSAKRELNFMFSEWANRGVNLWEVARTQTALTQGIATYPINPNIIMMLDVSVVLNIGTASESRRTITPIPRSQYMTLANQQVQGQPSVYWFDRLIAPSVTLWPVPDGAGPYTLDWMGYTQMQDANIASGETPDVPERWFDAIIAGLAHRLARIYRSDIEARRGRDADKAWMIAADQDIENVPLSIGRLGYRPGDKFLQ